MIYKIKMWIFKKLFPKKYCEEVGKLAAKKLCDAFDRITITMNNFSKSVEAFQKKSGMGKDGE